MFGKIAEDDQEIPTDDEAEISQNWIEYQEHYDDTYPNNESARMICCFCNDLFLSLEQRFLHESICNLGSIKRFSCKQCKINFRLKQGLQRHERRHQEPGGFLCSFCDATFTSSVDRMRHRNAEHRVYGCQICEAKFRRQSDYVGHIVKFHSAKDENFDMENIHLVKVEQLTEENDVSITHTLQAFEELDDWEDLKSKEKSEESPDIGIFNGTVSFDVLAKRQRKIGSSFIVDPLNSEQEIENSNDIDFFDFSDSLIGNSKPDLGSEENKISLEDKISGPSKQFNCKFCTKQYTCYMSLWKHRKHHGPDGKLGVQCSMCGKLLADRLSHGEHMKIHRNQRLKCNYCEKTYVAKQNLKIHIKKNHTETWTSKNRNTLKSALQDVEKSRFEKSSIKQCDVSEKKHQEKAKSFTQIKIKHSAEESNKIDSLDTKRGSNSATAKEDKCSGVNERITLPNTNYQDEFRPQNSCPEELYLQNLKSEHDINGGNKSVKNDKKDELPDTFKQFICKFCTKQYTCYQSLWKHLKLHGPDGKLRVKCTMCDKLFVDRQKKKEHMQTHRSERFICSYCKKTYSMKQNLQTHIELFHTKTRKVAAKKVYLCGKCGKSFTSPTALKDHEKSDCGKSPIYQCDVCEKFYHSAGSLKTHKLVHTNEFPNLCKYCGKGFRLAAHMKSHERVHTGEKPFQCTYCLKAFSHRESLLTHLSIHTGFKRFMCSGCGQRFTCISSLQSHRRAHADSCGLVPNCTKAVGPGEKFPLEI